MMQLRLKIQVCIEFFLHFPANLFVKDIASYLKLPPVKLHCSMLAEDAIKKAVEDYKSK